MISTDHFKPIKVVEVELSQPLPTITSQPGQGRNRYSKALVLALLHTYPLGSVEIDFVSDEINPVDLAVECWAVFSEEINAHLLEDGLMLATHLPTNGLVSEAMPKCLANRLKSLDDAPLISVIIATRERVQSLERTLNSLFEQIYPQFEIILVDNAPKTSATHDFFMSNQAGFLSRNIELKYVREDVPGLAIAHNRGIEAVRGSIVAFTDDDVLLDKYWLAEIRRGFQRSSKVGCVTGLVMPLELETPAQVLFEEFGGFTKGFTPQIYDRAGFRPHEPLFPYAAGRFGTGANMAFRTEYLQNAGGFEPALGIGTPALGADDMAAFYEVIRRGYQLVYQPSALVFHQHRQTMQQLRRQMSGYGVGLTAFLAKCVFDNPSTLVDFIQKIPTAARYAFDPESKKNQHKSTAYPAELEWIERKGMLYGPFAYLYSCWHYRNLRKSNVVIRSPHQTPLSEHYLVPGWMEDASRER